MTTELRMGIEAQRPLAHARGANAWALVLIVLGLVLGGTVLAWTGGSDVDRTSARTIPDVELDDQVVVSPVSGELGFRPVLRRVPDDDAAARTAAVALPATAPASRASRATGTRSTGRGQSNGSTRGGRGGTTVRPPATGGGTSGSSGTGASAGTGVTGNEGNGQGGGSGGQAATSPVVPVVTLPPTAVGPATTPGTGGVSGNGSSDAAQLPGPVSGNASTGSKGLQGG